VSRQQKGKTRKVKPVRDDCTRGLAWDNELHTSNVCAGESRVNGNGVTPPRTPDPGVTPPRTPDPPGTPRPGVTPPGTPKKMASRSSSPRTSLPGNSRFSG